MSMMALFADDVYDDVSDANFLYTDDSNDNERVCGRHWCYTEC